MKDKIKELILARLQINNGINAIDMVMKVMSELGPTGFTTEEYHEAYEELLENEEMIRLEFLCPSISLDRARAKTLLFAKGTTFLNLGEINGQERDTNQTDLVRESR